MSEGASFGSIGAGMLVGDRRIALRYASRTVS